MYQLTPDPQVVRRLTDGAFVPLAPGNRDYPAFLAWLAAGHTPQPAEE